MWHDKIEKLIYINLDKRTDRNEELLEQLNMIQFPKEKIMRFSAICSSLPLVGCCLSHAAVLKLAHDKGYSNVLILEDDCNFIDNPEKINTTMNSFFTEFKDYDALLLTKGSYKVEDCQSHLFERCIKSSNAVAYLVSNKIILPLSMTIEEGARKLRETGEHWNCANDQVWCKYMEQGKWYSVKDKLCYQRPSYSDLSGCYVDNFYER